MKKKFSTQIPTSTNNATNSSKIQKPAWKSILTLSSNPKQLNSQKNPISSIKKDFFVAKFSAVWPRILPFRMTAW